jgi:hypothetical protein
MVTEKVVDAYLTGQNGEILRITDDGTSTMREEGETRVRMLVVSGSSVASFSTSIEELEVLIEEFRDKL